MTDAILAPNPAATPAPPQQDGEVDDAPASRAFLTLTIADLRLFVICYLAGLVFFLVMLS